MTWKEANKLANHIAIFSVDHNLGYNPQLKQVGNSPWVVFLKGKNWYVWSWQEWKTDFEHDLVLEPEESEVEA